MPRGRSGFLLATLALAGCSGDDDAPIKRDELPRLVITQRDVGPGWREFDRGAQVQADRVPGPREDLERFGRVAGWKSRFRRPGTPETRGALVVESRVDVFETEDGARDDLEAYGQELDEEARALGGRRTEAPALGDGAVAITYAQPGLNRVRYYRVAWRDANATASVTANGFDGKFSMGDVLVFARRQEARIARAARD